VKDCRRSRRSYALVVTILAMILGAASHGQSGTLTEASEKLQQTPPQSTFFATAAEESYSTYQLPGDGDLWPSCWSDDDNLYTANGDGVAFTHGKQLFDMAVSRIHGVPPALQPETVASDVGSDWSGPRYNRKPTGMLCIDGDIYLAFQNLTMNTFSDTPAASIAKSSDHGATWKWDTTAPMFGSPGNPNSALAYKFTTLFFLDYGRNSAHRIDRYVYAYGLDNNWRSQQALYLARVPANKIQARAAWEFYTGTIGDGKPRWSPDITRKAAVLTDSRVVYREAPEKGTVCADHTHTSDRHVISQGGVVYDAPLHRYLFTSWSCATQEFYEAPQPWGPWKHFLSKDFGLRGNAKNYGQYGTSVPSKYISADGQTLYLQSNVWVKGYTFALRKLYLAPYVSTPPIKLPGRNLALEPGTRAISKSTEFGSLCGVDCSNQLASGPLDANEDDFDLDTKAVDWWGYTWPRPYRIDQLVYRTGDIFPNGGWYAGDLRVQVRQNFKWIDVTGVTIAPPYPYSPAAGAHATHTFTFAETWGDGVRIVGAPGGTSQFTSISRLGVFDGDPKMAADAAADAAEIQSPATNP
jgi:hypothetical protein